MRLICGNCDAQYEVEAEMIPPEGRDVQCSACSHVWFEPGRTSAIPAPPPGPVVPRRISTASFRPAADEQFEDDDPDLPPLSDTDLPPLRRAPLDEEMLAILREEAARETAARAAEALGAAPAIAQADVEAPPPAPEVLTPEPKEIFSASGTPGEEAHAPFGPEPEAEVRDQPLAGEAETAGSETGSDPRVFPPPPPRPEEEIEEARFIEEPPPADEPVDTEVPTVPLRASRRDLLPDIEQINSTLESTPHSDFAAGEAISKPAGQRSGFARGFALMILLALLLAVLYLKNDDLKAALPAAAPTLTGYADLVDQARSGLARLVSGFLGEPG
ncbi:zinc-ribbon domain-containing protein [Falsigemmobacter intermedius]|uniref:Zinc finger/thioredoxin putative domain-containing protein n=1 Tax=Falsigemmobacter intermedius TaxID=1553448 RepID=A0A3S3V809_9RHOB|nr:zinc-ribbon domain-containing protein [Falsigemmobacter intermedius]RWY43290.1 hypothetical protein EP867_05130 [Falsigemmobacter intermedius]